MKGQRTNKVRDVVTVFSSLPESLLPVLDRLASEHEVTRSRFIAIIIQAYINAVEDVSLEVKPVDVVLGPVVLGDE